MIKKISIQTTINAPLEQVWDRFTNPTHITHWAFASDDWSAPRAENDIRTGGKFLTRMEAKDGSVGFNFEGTYTNIVPLEKIEYEILGGRKVVIDFAVDGEVITVTETFDPENENSIEMQRAGWQAILDNFKKYTERT